MTDLRLELGGEEAGTGSGPGLGSEFEKAVAGPVRKDADEVPEVSLGVEVVQAGGGDEGEEVASADCVVIAADEDPGLATDGDTSQRPLGAIVLEFQPTVVEEAAEGVLLAGEVAQGGAQEAPLVFDGFVLGQSPGEEGVDMRAQVGVAKALSVLGRSVSPGGLQLEEASDAGESLGKRRKPRARGSACRAPADKEALRPRSRIRLLERHRARRDRARACRRS